MTEKTSGSGTTLLIVSIVQFFTPYMMSAVGIALPSIGREFQASAFQLGLVETAYILGVSIFLVPAGRMADIKGRKKIYTLGILLFTIATCVIAFSGSIRFFIVVRFIQGAGASLIVSTSIAILTSVFPPEQRGRAMGIVVACVYAGLSAGPGLGGLIVTYFGWRFVFAAVIPFQIITLYLSFFKLKGEWAEAKGEKFDWPGSIIYMVSLVAMISGAAFIKKDISGYFIMAGGFSGLIFFLVFESFIKFPVLNVKLLRYNRVFALSNLATMINYASSFGITFLFSLYLQTTKGLSPKAAGFVLIVQPLVQSVLSPGAGRLSDRFSSSKIATIGMGICAFALFLCSFVDADTPVYLIYCVLVIMGIGFAVFSSPNMNTVMGSVESRYYGVAASLVATMRTFGMLVSMTTVTLIFSVVMGDMEVSAKTSSFFVKSMQTAFMLFAGLSVIGVFCSLGRIKKQV